MSYDYIFSASISPVTGTIFIHEVRVNLAKFGFVFDRFAFHVGVLQICVQFANKSFFGFCVVFGIDAEYRINEIVAFYAEYEPPRLSGGSGNGVLQHSLNFGMKINMLGF